MRTRVIAWWSGGITSAVACLWAVQTFKDVVIVFQDTKNEDADTYRFLKDCENLYSQPIERISRIGRDYKSIEEVWLKFESLAVAHGAICSTVLKREVREAYQNLKTDYAQVFGFDKNERNRHLSMRRNYPEINVFSPLVDLGISKADCARMFSKLGIQIPNAYKLGFQNNNCLQTGCVRGGIGYWQKYKEVFPDRFDRMAERERKLTALKGEPVTICKDQSKGGGLVFLKPNPKYPDMKDISMMKGRQPESIMECNGFCSTTD
jgi:3'-phosphoadenosine 5'-phosphosulfate sulfotransferase (PAPS reductase)/FAD synthetase